MNIEYDDVKCLPLYPNNFQDVFFIIFALVPQSFHQTLIDICCIKHCAPWNTMSNCILFCCLDDISAVFHQYEGQNKIKSRTTEKTENKRTTENKRSLTHLNNNTKRRLSRVIIGKNC